MELELDELPQPKLVNLNSVVSDFADNLKQAYILSFIYRNSIFVIDCCKLISQTFYENASIS